jgi:hypothetical protein
LPVRPEVDEPEPASNIAIHANFLDFALWGLTGAIDVEIVQKYAVFTEVRVPNAGALSYFDFWPMGPGRISGYHSNYLTHFSTGYGGTLGAEKFFGEQRGLRGLYVALGLEVLNHQMTVEGTGWTPGTVNEWFVAPHARAGVRWRSLAFLFALGLRAGVGLMAASTFSNAAGTVPWGATRRIYFDGGLILDMGFFLR